MNYTQSNYLIDTIMPQVKPTTFKVISLIARHTWGWNRDCVELSYADIRRMTNISSDNTIKAAIEEAATFIAQTSVGEQGYCYAMQPIPETVSNFDISKNEGVSKNDIVPPQNLIPPPSNFDTVEGETVSKFDRVTRLPKEEEKERRERKKKEEEEPPKPPLRDNPFPYRPSPITSRHESPADARVAAVLEVCQMSANIPSHLAQAENAAAQINSVSAGYIRDRYGRHPANGHWNWYADHWKGRDKGEAPTPKMIVDTIFLVRQETAVIRQGKTFTDIINEVDLSDILGGNNGN